MNLFKESFDTPAPNLALMERKTEDELLNLSEMSVSNVCSGCTHWEFCVLNMQLAIYSLGNALLILSGSSK